MSRFKKSVFAAVAVGGRPILVLTGNGRATAASVGEVETYPDLLAAATRLAAEPGQGGG